MKTGLCCFTKNADEYILNEQINSIIESEDEVQVLRVNEDFSPAEADRMIETCIINGCDKLFFLAESDMSTSLLQLLTEEYGDKFKEIAVADELYSRELFYESDMAQTAQTVQQAAVKQQPNAQRQQPQQQKTPQQPQPKRQVKNNPKLQPVNGLSIHVFISDAAFPATGLLNNFLNGISSFESQINADTTPHKKAAVFADYNEQKHIYVRSQVLPELWKSFPSQEKDLVDKVFANKFIEVPQGNPMKLEDVDALVNNLMIRGAAKVTLYGHNIVQPTDKNVKVVPMNSFANPKNAEIYAIAKELTGKDVKRNKKKEEEILELAKKDAQFITYVKNLLAAIKNYEETKSRVFSDESIKSAFIEAVKNFALADAKGFLQDAEQAGLGPLIDIAKAVGKDIKGTMDDTKKDDGKEISKGKPNTEELDKEARHILTYEKYDLLKELCGIKA